MQHSLFADPLPKLPPGVHYWPQAITPAEREAVLTDLRRLLAEAPPTRFTTRGGNDYSMLSTNCGDLGWWSDRMGYRYLPSNPETSRPWPAIPPLFRSLACRLAEAGGWAEFDPDCCLINIYGSGAKLGLHQDSDEADFSRPIVGLSFGASADFILGGLQRTDKTNRLPVHDGDGIAFGGPSRLIFHGIGTIKPGGLRLKDLPEGRISLTFRHTGLSRRA
jgi:alkylated DNA repair protein (DNA oxidative demethylase)